MSDLMQDDEVPIMVLTNEPTELKVRTLELIYQSLSYGQIAYMDGKDPDTGEVVPMLVALEPAGDNKVTIYPIARLFDKNDKLTEYLVPDGLGNYRNVGAEPVDIHTSEEEGTAEGLDQATVH
jgi:hypothetical protein